MKRAAIAVAAAMILQGASAFVECWMMRVPDSLEAEEGTSGFKMPHNDPKAISIPLKDGSHVVVVNMTPYRHGEGKFGASGIGEVKNVADGDVVSRMAAAAAKIPTVKVNMGGVTLFATYEDFPKMYSGKIVSRGGSFMVYIGLPPGRTFDPEIREALAQVAFVPPADFGIEQALRLYGKLSRMKPAAKFPVLKKMVEERAECVELIEALRDAAAATGHADTVAWCDAALKKLNPAVHAPDGIDSVRSCNLDDEGQAKALEELLGADVKFEKATAEIPPLSAKTAAPRFEKTVMLPGDVPMEFIWCGKGTFTMGQNDGEYAPTEKQEPRRKVTLSKGFWLAKYETTQRQWKSVVSGTPSKFKGDDLPVDNISWNQSRLFADEVRNKTGRKVELRLPTEAEWEYACRAGTRTPYWWGYGAPSKKANCNGQEGPSGDPDGANAGKTVKAGSYPPNPWGFFDMAGNVAEWCEDDWLEEPSPEPARDPIFKDYEKDDRKVLRGGSWEDSGEACRSADRVCGYAKKSSSRNGARFVLVADAPEGSGEEKKDNSHLYEHKPRFAPDPPKPREPDPVPPEHEVKGNKTKTLTLPGGETMVMVWCPPGTFMMGSPKTEKGRADRERQIKTTLTKGFWIGKYEVTQKQFYTVTGKYPGKEEFRGDDLPVGMITWPLADEFCKAVGQGARLPTSAEWEYACRAGTETAYPWGDSCNGKEANCDGTRPCGTDEKGPNLERPVKGGSYMPNPWGICDMNGNMMEWCFDRDKSYDRDVKELVDPKGDDTETLRVIRGGSFMSRPQGCRSGWRYYDNPGIRNLNSDYGFRIVVDE